MDFAEELSLCAIQIMSEKVYWVEFIGDRSVKVTEGQSVLSASLQAGIRHYHACGGIAQCSTCRVLVREGAECLSPPNEAELELRKKISLPPNVRLACQSFVTGNCVRLHRIIRDETDMALYVREDEKSADALGEEKELALFFLDIRDFTPFMQTYLPFDIIHIMRRLFYLFRNVIEQHKGRVIETSGDGLYAVFGFRHEGIEEATQDAVDAGHQISKEIKEFNQTYLETHFNHFFEIGIGIHVGKTIVGNIGLGVNESLTVMGLAVNIASRLQNATKELNNSFIISEDAFSLLNKHLPATETETAEIKLKGVNGLFKVHLIGKPFLRYTTAPSS